MKITRRQLRKIIAEEIAVVKKDKIADVVLDVLADEGGAAGLEPIEDALKELEDEEIELPDEPVEDLVSAVPGVKRHADGDYIETTKLESVMRISESRLRRIIREAMGQDGVFPDLSHPLIKDFADKVQGPIKGREGGWFVEYQTYKYNAGGQSDQGIVV